MKLRRRKGMTKLQVADHLLGDTRETRPACAQHMDTPCLEHNSIRKDVFGYARVHFNGKDVTAHRLINEAKKGPLGRLVSRHLCNNTSCINPDHLERGTQKDNIADMIRSNRQPCRKGSNNGNAVLNASKVMAIRARVAKGQTQASVARMYGVSANQVNLIVHYKVWKDAA